MEYAPQWVGMIPRPKGPASRPWTQRPSVGADHSQPENAQPAAVSAENTTAKASAAEPAKVQVEWVRRAQQGDLQAFELLFNQYQRGIYNLVYQMVRNDTDAADLTQDAFIRAWKALPRLQAPEAFPSWLYRVATNLGRNWIRDHGRVRHESLDQPFSDDEDSGQRDVADWSKDPAAATQTADMKDVVQRAISTLSDDHRTVVTLHHIEGMAVEEIAGIMQCSVGTVKSRLSRARDHLRRKLAGYVEAS